MQGFRAVVPPTDHRTSHTARTPRAHARIIPPPETPHLRHRSAPGVWQGRGPSATVVAVRQRNGQLDYLTLADSPLIVDIDGEVRAIADDRTAHLTDYSHEGVRAARNAPDGFYVASTMPDAAYKAIRGTLPASQVRRAALLSDGAARLVERFRHIDWRELLDLLTTEGPDLLICRTRDAELAETDTDRATRRGKRHDDATAVLLTQLDRATA